MIIIFAFSWPLTAVACDPCSLYSVRKLQIHSKGSFSVALSEQFTKLERIEQEGLSTQQTKGFSTSQFSTGYDAFDNLGFQLNIPFIARNFTKAAHAQESNEYDTGVGDISIGTNFSPIIHRSSNSSIILALSGTVKLPTGDTGSLNSASNGPARLAHHTSSINSTSGGRTLTIGTGSVDYIFGTSLSTRYEKFIWLSSFQYSIRTKGDFGYRFDNDIVWSTGPGAYLILKENQTVALRAVFSGEHKGRDTLKGNKVTGSSLSNLYLGPELIITLNKNWIGDLGLDLPTYVDESDSSLKPTWRVRTSLSYRF